LLQKRVADRCQSADEALGDLRESTIEFIPIGGDSAIKPPSRIKSKSGSDFFESPDENPFPDVPASRPPSPLSLPSATAATPPVLAQTQRYTSPGPSGPFNPSATPPMGTPNPNPIPPRPQRQTTDPLISVSHRQPRKSGAMRILLFAVLGLLV